VLTEVSVKAARPQERPYKLFDGRGLYLFVAPTGGRLWRLKYRLAGRERLLALGAWPSVSLKRAREKRDEARRLIADGIDPSAERRKAKAALADTFRAVSDEWLAKQGATLELDTVARLKSWLDVVAVSLGTRSIASIEPPELLAVLRRIEHRGKHETAHRTLATVGRVYRYAIATGRAKRDISADLRGALTPVVANNFAAVTDPAKVGALLRAIDAYQGQPSVQYALKLAPYVFVRPGELRGARWSEFSLDGKESTWRIPAARMKMDREHIVPLSRQAVALIEALHSFTGDSEFLFPALSYRDRPISDTAINAALRRMGYSTQDEMTGHGFRSMASTLLNEQGYHPDLIELQLAHHEKNKTRAAYNRAQRLEDRRRMMQAWADYLDGLRRGGKVVPIRRGRVP
jgi:integrase